MGILLTGPPGTNFNEILIEIHTFSFKKFISKYLENGGHFVSALKNPFRVLIMSTSCEIAQMNIRGTDFLHVNIDSAEGLVAQRNQQLLQPMLTKFFWCLITSGANEFKCKLMSKCIKQAINDKVIAISHKKFHQPTQKIAGQEATGQPLQLKTISQTKDNLNQRNVLICMSLFYLNAEIIKQFEASHSD